MNVVLTRENDILTCKQNITGAWLINSQKHIRLFQRNQGLGASRERNIYSEIVAFLERIHTYGNILCKSAFLSSIYRFVGPSLLCIPH
jgi:hypothetical protein